MLIEPRDHLRLPVQRGPGLLLRRIGKLQPLLSGAFASLNLRVVRGKSLAFRWCLSPTDCPAIILHGHHLSFSNVLTLGTTGLGVNESDVKARFISSVTDSTVSAQPWLQDRRNGRRRF